MSPLNISYIFENFTKEEVKKLLGHQTDEDFFTEEKKCNNGYASYNRTFILFLLVEKESGKVIGRVVYTTGTWSRKELRLVIT